MKFSTAKREAVLAALRQGARRGKAAESVGIAYETLRATMRAEPAFAAAVDEAEVEACEQVEDALFQAAVKGNVTAQQVWLYNRMPTRWKDRRRVEADALGDILNALPPEFARQVKEAMGRAG